MKGTGCSKATEGTEWGLDRGGRVDLSGTEEREVSRGRGLACLCSDGATGLSSKWVTSCSFPPTQRRSLGVMVCSPGPFQSCSAPYREERPSPPEPLHFTFQSSKVPLKGEKEERKEMSAPTKEEHYSK